MRKRPAPVICEGGGGIRNVRTDARQCRYVWRKSVDFVYDFSFVNCQSCSAKIHCEDCGTNLEERIAKTPGVERVSIDIQNKRIHLSTNGLDEDELLDFLEEVGIFAG